MQRIEGFFTAHEYSGRIKIHQSARPDLLLHELYQKLTLSLPGGGLTYEYTSNVPPSRAMPDHFPNESAHKAAVGSTNERSLRTTMLKTPLAALDGEVVRVNRDRLSVLAGEALAKSELSSPEKNGKHAEDRRLYFIGTGESLAVSGPNRLSLDRDKALRDNRHRPQSIIVFDAAFQTLEALSIPYARFQQLAGRQCLWFELTDYMDADSLLRDILRALALRAGRYQRKQVTLHPLQRQLNPDRRDQEHTLRVYLDDMCRVHRISPSHWKIFIYGREAAGSCVGWVGAGWTAADWNNLATVLRAFATVGFHIVYSIPTAKRMNREQGKINDAIKRISEKLLGKRKTHTGLPAPGFKDLDRFLGTPNDRDDGLKKLRDAICPTDKSPSDVPGYETSVLAGKELTPFSLFISMVEAIESRLVLDDHDEVRRFEEFLYAAALFRQSRRPSALFFEAVQSCPRRYNLNGVDNDLIRAEDASRWTNLLRKHRIFYDKAGGHSWMHRDIKIVARARLDRDFRVTKSQQIRFHGEHLARTQFWIGEWYFKAFCSTGFVLPIIECLHHRFQAAIAAPFAHPKNLPSADAADVAAVGTLSALQNY